jgi:hypothetical protein
VRAGHDRLRGAGGHFPPKVAESTDGGSTWTDETPSSWAAQTIDLDGISCPSVSVCYAAGGVLSGQSTTPPAVAKLSGGNWSLTPTTGRRAGRYLRDISCATVSSCTAVGGDSAGHAEAATTTNGGSSWTIASDSLLTEYSQFTSISCPTAADCFGTTNFGGNSEGTILHTTDGGLKWSVALTNWASDLGGIDCLGSVLATTHCWAAGAAGSTAATADGGKHWYAQPLGFGNGNVSVVSCASVEDCWTTADGRVSATTTGGRGVPLGRSATTLASYPAKPMIGEVAFLVALVTDGGGQQPVDDVDFTFQGTPISFCTNVAVAHAPGQIYAVCSLFFEAAGTFTLGARYSGDYYAGPSAASVAVPVHHPGYRFVAADGGIFSFGGLHFDGSVPGVHVHTEGVVGMASDLETGGYWVASSDGAIFSFAAHFYGSAAGHLTAPVTGIAATDDYLGYWLVGPDGNVYSYGDAFDEGRVVNVPASDPIVGIASNVQGGYWLVGRDGDVYAFGGAPSYGSLKAGQADDIVGIVSDALANGYWLVGANGAVFAFGKAGNFGSMAGTHLTKPIVGIASDPATGGYWLVGSDGGIFSFRAPFLGSTGNIKLNQPIDGMAVG